jgi:ABC-type Fe3+ transport system permease subunit
VRVDLLLMFGALAAGTLLAELFGATNLGTALTFGVMAFAAVATWIVVKRPG